MAYAPILYGPMSCSYDTWSCGTVQHAPMAYGPMLHDPVAYGVLRHMYGGHDGTEGFRAVNTEIL
eukprot:3414598-Rhodomonas_salina.1